jgi:AcrR family transcriptional regulator
MSAHEALRADAQRNRARLLDVAVHAFHDDGPDVTMDSIAKAAHVGIGTLYRHFPTRESLVEAVYRSELARVCDRVEPLSARLRPDEALRAWMDGFIAYMATKRQMADALRVVIASGRNPYSESRDRLLDAIGTLLRAGTEARVVRPDVQPGDVLASLSGISLVAGEPDQRDLAQRLLDLLMDGLRRPRDGSAPLG